jgi:colanic acid biosynthesis glycosyl transferase WcaI
VRVTIVGLNYAPERSGIAPYTTGLAEGLVAQGHSVRVVTSVPHYPEWKIPKGYTAKSERDTLWRGVAIRRVRPRVPIIPSSIKRSIFELSFGIRAALAPWGRPDVTILVSPALLACPVLLLRARACLGQRPALGLWVQDLYSAGITETGAGGQWVARVFAGLERLCAEAVDGVAVIHNRFRLSLVRLGVAPSKVSVIRNWSHLGEPPALDFVSFRASMGWATDEVVVLHAGAMGAKQGLEAVVDAAAIADRTRAPVRFVLLGDGSRRRSLEARGRGVARLAFLDPVDDATYARLLSAADVLLVNERPGVSEMAVPSKLTSYMKSGRPILAATSARSATAEEIAESLSGVRIDPENSDVMVTEALRLGRDKRLATELGRNGQRYCSEVLSETAAISRFGAWIEELARRPTKGKQP